MGRFSAKRWLKVAATMGTVTLFSSPFIFAGQNPRKMNCGARIECTTPDGHAGHVSRLSAPDPSATALIMDDDTVTCLLQEGETNFVIELPQSASLDRFTFVNENSAARGELRISVSNQRLAPNSSEWTDVEGIIPFAHKRLFGVSLLGIEAKYVRLSFHVEKKQPERAVGTAKVDNKREPAKSVNRFAASAFDDALNSNFGTACSRGAPVLLNYMTSSVAPLSSSVPAN